MHVELQKVSLDKGNVVLISHDCVQNSGGGTRELGSRWPTSLAIASFTNASGDGLCSVVRVIYSKLVYLLTKFLLYFSLNMYILIS